MRLIDMGPLLSRQRSIRRTHFLLWLICLITATLQTSLLIINEGKIATDHPRCPPDDLGEAQEMEPNLQAWRRIRRK
ncbi:hypothetical protein SRHO_G00095880 [Serrasalmus rhombeus]